ncbi:UDP-N-acetylmuramate dehydrogenase [Vibrio cyclitrophicus]
MQKLSEKMYWKIGGNCNEYYQVNSEKELKDVIKNADLSNVIVIGNGTNLLFDSEGFNGTVIKLGHCFDYVKKTDDLIEVGSSTWVPGLVRKLSQKGKGSLDHCIGIPATIGGLVVMNGGSQRRSISENITSVRVMDYKGDISIIDRSECEFNYRKSIFLNNDFIVLSVVLRLENITPNSNRNNLINILKERRSKFPRKDPNCGSVFKSSKELYDRIGPPGYIIESLGLKGYSIGGAKISNKHANFIINTGNATSNDVLQLVNYINHECYNKYGFRMESEAIYIDRSGFRCSLDKV